MSRLASFKGPSTPSPSPVRAKQNPQSPASPSRLAESTFHRRTRTLLQELRNAAHTWDDIVLVDGLKAARILVDTRTELNNALELSAGTLPRTRVVGPKVAVMEKQIVELDAVLVKLEKQFRRMSTVIDNLESLLAEAHKAKGWKWVHEEALWMTWTLEKFVTSLPSILVSYHRALEEHRGLVDALRRHSVSFEVSRATIARWATQEWLQEEGWQAAWEDLCAVEVERWATP